MAASEILLKTGNFSEICQKAVIDRPPKRFYEFDAFRIDLEERRLLRLGEPVQLTPKVFDILLTLVENHGHTIGKDKLMESVWADAFVEEGNLNRNVSTLRKVLGEERHEPRLIKTVPKRGYRFDGDVREVVEEYEDLVVEKRTKYSVSFKENISVRTGLSRRALAFAAAGLLVILAVGWAVIGPQRSDANALTDRSKQKTNNAEALELYTKARAQWQNRSVEGLHQATIDLERAIALDPEFALAHAALADAYVFDVFNWKKAEEAANRAILVDPTLGQPHATIGFVRTFWERRLNDADAYFRRAISLEPNYATAHQWYALNLTARSQGGGGLAEIIRAIEIEPYSAPINADLCQILYLARKFDQAIDQCRKTLEIDPDLISAHRHLYEIYTAKEMYPQAIEAFFKAEQLNMTTQTYPAQLEQLRKAYDEGGIRGFWRERLAQLNKGTVPPAYAIARYHARLGETEEALAWYQTAVKGQEFEFLFFANDPANFQLLHDPRGREIANALTSR